MFRHVNRITLALALVLAGFQTLAWSATPVRDHDIVMEDYFTLSLVGACQASPDGRQIVYSESRWEPPSEKRNTDLWIVSSTGKQSQRVTFDSAADSAPQWNSDSRFIYFRSNRKRSGEKNPPYNGKPQVWRLTVDGGALIPMTRVPQGVGQFELATDGSSLYYTTTTEHVDEEWKELKTQYKKLKYGHGMHKFSQLWKLDVASWRAEKLVDESRVVVDFAVAPDQQRIAMITRPDEGS